MERDDLIEYSLDGHHSEEEGKAMKKDMDGYLNFDGSHCIRGWTWRIYQTKLRHMAIVKWTFVALTLLKAGYIVMVFMHLGDERKWLRNVILIPYTLFILYLIFIALWEALAIGDAWMAA